MAGRSVRALVGCLEDGEPQWIILNDNVAARHLRIKAEGLREAVTTGEWTLRHGLTKQLPLGPQSRMIAGMRMVEESGPQVRAIRGPRLGVDAERLSGAVGLVAAMGCCAQGARAEDGEDAERLWAIVLVVFMMAGYIIRECVKRLGLGEESDVKVEVFWRWSPRGELTMQRAGTAGVSIGPGVIDRDFRGEIKIMVMNGSTRQWVIRAGDRVAQLVVERVHEGGMRLVDHLTETQRGAGGFGSTVHGAPSLRSLSVGAGRVSREIGVDTEDLFDFGVDALDLWVQQRTRVRMTRRLCQCGLRVIKGLRLRKARENLSDQL